MIEIFKDLAIKGEYLCLQNSGQACFLSGMKENQMEHYMRMNQRSQNPKIMEESRLEITSKMKEFIKYMINLIANLKCLNLSIFNALSSIYKLSQASSFEMLTEELEKTSTLGDAKDYVSTLKKTVSTKQNNNELIGEVAEDSEISLLLRSYENLLVEIMSREENSNNCIFFKNPLKINRDKLRTLQFNILYLTKSTSENKRLESYESEKDILSKISKDLKKDNLKVRSHMFVINLRFVQWCDCINDNYECHCFLDLEFKGYYTLPEIECGTVFIKKNIDIEGGNEDKVERVTKSFSCSTSENVEIERLKIFIQINECNNISLKTKKNKMEISSILEDYRCFLVSSQKSLLQLSSSELFLEESYLLMISAVHNENIYLHLLNNISMIFTDLFIL